MRHGEYIQAAIVRGWAVAICCRSQHFNASFCKLGSVFMVSAGRKNRRAEARYLDMLPLSCLGRGIHTVRRPSAAFVGSLATAIWFSVGVRSPCQVTPRVA